MSFEVCAGVAQLVEQLICNQQVGGSNPSTSSTSEHAVDRLASSRARTLAPSAAAPLQIEASASI